MSQESRPYQTGRVRGKQDRTKRRSDQNDESEEKDGRVPGGSRHWITNPYGSVGTTIVGLHPPTSLYSEVRWLPLNETAIVDIGSSSPDVIVF